MVLAEERRRMKNRGSWVSVKDGISMSFSLLCHTKDTGFVCTLDAAKAGTCTG